MVCETKLKPRTQLHRVLYLSTQLKICINFDNIVIHFCCLQTVYHPGLSLPSQNNSMNPHGFLWKQRVGESSILHMLVMRMIMADREESACANSCTLSYGSITQVFLQRKSTVFMCRKQADRNMQFCNTCTVNITSMYNKWTEIHNTTLYSCSKIIQGRNSTAITSEICITY